MALGLSWPRLAESKDITQQIGLGPETLPQVLLPSGHCCQEFAALTKDPKPFGSCCQSLPSCRACFSAAIATTVPVGL